MKTLITHDTDEQFATCMLGKLSIARLHNALEEI